jgi:hypothetical protein
MADRHARSIPPAAPLIVLALLLMTVGPGQPATAAPPVPPPVSFDTAAGANTFYAVGQNPDHVLVADLNGDGFPDLVIVNTVQAPGPPGPGLANNDDFVSILLGTVIGTFQAPKAVDLGTTGDTPEFATVADFNGDSVPDLAITLTNGPVASGPVVVIAIGNGTGNFTVASAGSQPIQPTGVLANAVPTGIIAGDFNGDNKSDLAIVDENILSPSCPPTCPNGFVDILLGDGLGSFGAPTRFTVGTAPWNIVVGDFNNDSHQDLAVTNQGITATPGTTVSILLGSGNGSFTAAASATVGHAPQGLAISDFNGDGKQDLAVANSGDGTVTTLLGNGAGAFAPSAGSPYAVGAGVSAVAVADFNGDGKPDVVTSDTNAPGAGTITVLRGNGDGTFQTGIPFNLPKDPDLLPNPPGPDAVADNAGPFFVAAGDFNRDTKPDVAVPDTSCQIAYCLVTIIPNTAPFTATFDVAAPASVVAGSTPTLTATAQTLANATTPAYTGTVQFTSSDPSATLPPNYTFTTGGGNDNGVHTFSGVSSVTLKKAGAQTVTLTDTTYTGITGQATITVTAAPTAPTLTNVPATTFANTSFTATVTSQDVYGNTVPGVITFQSSDPAAILPASVTFTDGGPASQQVTVTLTTAGSQSVTATNTTLAPNLAGSATVTVNANTVTQLALTGSVITATNKVGQAGQITATATFANSTSQDVTGQVTWSSSDPTIASVDSTGKVTFKSPGTVTITATFGGVTKTVQITVSAGAAVGVAPVPNPASRPGGTTSQPGASPPAPNPVPTGR